MTNDLMKKLMSGAVRPPEEPGELTAFTVSNVNGDVHLDFGKHLLVLEPEGALELAEILIKHAAVARGGLK